MIRIVKDAEDFISRFRNLRTESLEQVLPGINDQRNLPVQIHRIKQKSIESDPNPSPTNTSQFGNFWNRDETIICRWP